MEKKRRIVVYLALLLLPILSFFFLDSVFSIALESSRNWIFNDLFLGITFASSEIIIFFVLTSLFLWNKKKRWILPLWASLFLSAIVSFILKVLIKRPRPFQSGIVTVLPILKKASHLSWNFSFPSFQSMLVFSAVPLLNKEFRKFRYFWWAFAILVALSRVYFGLHYLSDVLFGAVIGYILGELIIKIETKKKISEKIINYYERELKK